MSFSLRHAAKVENFINFLNEAIEENKGAIREWVRLNLINQTDPKTAKVFFEATKELLIGYLHSNKIDKMVSLIQEFSSLNNPNLNKMELGLLERVLIQEESFISNHPLEKEKLSKVFIPLKDFALESSDTEVQDAWNYAKNILGASIEA